MKSLKQKIVFLKELSSRPRASATSKRYLEKEVKRLERILESKLERVA